MNYQHYKFSNITQRKYDMFKIVRILNIQQAIWYLSHDVPLEDIELSEDRKTGIPVLVFLFGREESQEAYDSWCKNKQ